MSLPPFPKINQNWPIYENNSLLNQLHIAMIEMPPRNMRLTSWGVKWSQWKRRSWLSKLWMNDGYSPRKIRCIHILFNFLGNWKNVELMEKTITHNKCTLSCLLILADLVSLSSAFGPFVSWCQCTSIATVTHTRRTHTHRQRCQCMAADHYIMLQRK